MVRRLEVNRYEVGEWVRCKDQVGIILECTEYTPYNSTRFFSYDYLVSFGTYRRKVQEENLSLVVI